MNQQTDYAETIDLGYSCFALTYLTQSSRAHQESELCITAYRKYQHIPCKRSKSLSCTPFLEMNNETDIGQNSRHATLFYAIANGHVEMVKLLLHQGASAINKDEASGLTPLALAAANGQNRVVKTLLQREDVIANWMFEAWKEDVRREAGGEKIASNTPRAVAFRNGHITIADMLARYWAALEPHLDFSNLPFCPEMNEVSTKFNPKSHKTTMEESHSDGSDNQKRGRSHDRDTNAKRDTNGTSAVFPLLPFMDGSMRKLRAQESHGNLGIQATLFGRKARSVSI